MSKRYCEGYTLFSYAGPGGNPTLIDMDGKVVHTWSIPAQWVKMLPGGSIMGSKRVRERKDTDAPMLPPPGGPPPHLDGPPPGGAPHGDPPPRHRPSFDGIEFVQEGWDGEEQWSFANWDDDGTGVMMSRQHHDSQREGNPVGYYAPGQDFVEKGKTLILGHKTLNIPRISKFDLLDDAIYEVDWEGNLTGFEWYSSDHFDEIGFDESAQEDLRTGCHADVKKGVFDWTHINTISVLGKNRWYTGLGDDRFHPDNIMISSRSANFIAIISRATKKIVWKAGPDFVAASPEFRLGQFVGQHHPHLIPQGLPGESNVLVFDNGGRSGYGGPDGYPRYTRDYSRVIEFDPITFDIVWEYKVESGEKKFFSHNISSAQRLPNGNTLIDEGAQGRIFEVTPDKEIVWEFSALLNTGGRARVYRAYRIPPEWVPGNPSGYTEWSKLYE